MSNHVVKPIGHVGLPGLLCGLAGTALAVGLDIMEFLKPLQARVIELFQGAPFYHEDFSVWQSHWDWSIAGGLAVLVAWAVLDSHDAWRRFFVGVMSLVLILGIAPVLVLWGMYWSPVVAGVAVVWSWFCALVYSSQHRMPCDIARHLGEEHIHLKTSEELIEEVVEEEHIRVETIPFPIHAKEENPDKEGNAKMGAKGDERWMPQDAEDPVRKKS